MIILIFINHQPNQKVANTVPNNRGRYYTIKTEKNNWRGTQIQEMFQTDPVIKF